MEKFNIHCPVDKMILAARAAQYAVTEMPNRDAIVVYGGEDTFYVKKNPKSYTVRYIEETDR